MNLRVIKKKFRQEVILDVDGCRNSNFVIARKFLALCLKVFGGFVLTLFLAPISLFRPIEIWHLRSRRSKISLLIEDLEWGLRNLQKRSLNSNKIIIIGLYHLPFPNKQLVKMYRRVLFLVGPSPMFLGTVFKFVLPVGRITKKNPLERYTTMFEVWNAGKPSIYFSKHEVELGIDLECRLFGSKTPPFVCFAVQSHTYKRAVDVPATRFYGPLRDDPFSSISGIENYLPVIKYLTGRGIAVVRMGVMEDKKLPSDLGPLVVDYAFDGRTEFGDLWLHSRCQFSINAGSGAHWLATVFNVPAVLTDSYAIRSLYDERSLFIPQRGWLSNEQRYLTFSEIGNSEFGRDKQLLQSGMQIIKNSPNEIIEVIEEMICRLAGTWIETRQDKDLQTKYRRLVNEFPSHHRTPAKMGAKFLREHQYLLPD
jgi:putative glycosyltransferase (TIGR04372 family)